MNSIRIKLFAGFGAVLALLLAIGLLAIRLLGDYSGMLERIFRENYDSVRYGQEMKQAADELEGAVRLHFLGDTTAAALALQGRERFLRNFQLQSHNITVDGEDFAVQRLQARWRTFDTIVAHSISRPSNAMTPEEQARVWSAADEIRAASQSIIDLNVGNIFSVDGQVGLGAARARRTLAFLLVAGVVLALGLSSVVSAWIIAPVRSLTNSAREISRGNLDLVVAARSRDELGELAEAFNAMTTRLREFRRSDRQRLWRIHRTTQNAIDTLPDAVAVIAPDGRIEMGNGAARRIFSLEPGATIEEHREGRLRSFFLDAIRTRETIQAKGFDAAIQVFDEGERFFLPRAIPIQDPDGSIAGVTLVLADITQLRRLDEMKSGMLSVVAHELRTPLTALRMSSHLLLDERLGTLEPRQEELAVALRDDAERLWRIVEELLDIGRMDAGRSLLEFSATDPAALALELARHREGDFRDKDVRLVVEAPSEGLSVKADRTRLSLALENLLSNALRHTPPGGEVKIAARGSGDLVTISVSDDGEGIAESDLPRVFERFYRAPGQSARGGVGLGLSIVRDIVEAHGGRVVVESVRGAGARFEISLPATGRTEGDPWEEVRHA